jgi:hypothetical protein
VFGNCLRPVWEKWHRLPARGGEASTGEGTRRPWRKLESAKTLEAAVHCRVLVWTGFAAIVALGGACSGGGGSVAGTGGGGSGDAGTNSPSSSSGDAGGNGSSSGDSASGALKIISFTSTTSKLTEGESIQFIAIVTDTAGLDAIAGGTLQDETGAVYGAFGAASQKGTYTVALTWDAISQVRSLGFASTSGHSRKFTAKFFDNGGATASSTLDIEFSCGSVGLACGGKCQSVTGVGPSSGTCDSYCTAMGNGLSCDWVNLYDTATCSEDGQTFSCSTPLSTIPKDQYYVCYCAQ